MQPIFSPIAQTQVSTSSQQEPSTYQGALLQRVARHISYLPAKAGNGHAR